MAAARDAAKAEEVFSELGLNEGISNGSGTVSTHLWQFIIPTLLTPEPSVLSLAQT